MMNAESGMLNATTTLAKLDAHMRRLAAARRDLALISAALRSTDLSDIRCRCRLPAALRSAQAGLRVKGAVHE